MSFNYYKIFFQVSVLFKVLVEHVLSIRVKLNITSEYFRIYEGFIVSDEKTSEIIIDKLINFLRNYMPSLQELSFRHAPCTFTLSNLIQVFNLILLNIEIANIMFHRFLGERSYRGNNF